MGAGSEKVRETEMFQSQMPRAINSPFHDIMRFYHCATIRLAHYENRSGINVKENKKVR
jgi:hypothetical protein